MASWNDIPIDSELAFAEAEKLGLKVMVADELTLQLDLDTPEACNQFGAYRGRLKAHFGAVDIRETVSRNGHCHAYVTLPQPMSIPERIALQACLGSDPTREFLSLKRWLDKDENPILLFEVDSLAPPPAAGDARGNDGTAAARKD